MDMLRVRGDSGRNAAKVGVEALPIMRLTLMQELVRRCLLDINTFNPTRTQKRNILFFVNYVSTNISTIKCL